MDIPGILTRHEQYKYILIFLLAIPEGTILTLTCGFFITIGFLNPILTYALIVSGDAVMDSIVYGVGRIGSPVLIRLCLKIGLTQERVNHTRQRFASNRLKVLVVSKLMHGPGTIGLMMAGTAPHRIFTVLCELSLRFVMPGGGIALAGTFIRSCL